MSLTANDLHGRHLIVKNDEWKMIINALDVLEMIVNRELPDADLVNELRWSFEPSRIAELSNKIVNTS